MLNHRTNFVSSKTRAHADRSPLSDWKIRLDYYAKRIERFHQREFQGQSKLTVKVRDQIFSSKLSTEQLRVGDASQISFVFGPRMASWSLRGAIASSIMKG
jgi:hypothetical protein